MFIVLDYKVFRVMFVMLILAKNIAVNFDFTHS